MRRNKLRCKLKWLKKGRIARKLFCNDRINIHIELNKENN